MTTTYTLRDGGRIVAISPKDFVHQLHVSSFFDHQGTDEEYMQRFAKRIQELDGTVIRTECPDYFLADLIDCGFVVI